MLLGIEFPRGRLWSERETSHGLKIGVSWLALRSREHIEYGVVEGRRLFGRSIGWP